MSGSEFMEKFNFKGNEQIMAAAIPKTREITTTVGLLSPTSVLNSSTTQTNNTNGTIGLSQVF